MRIRNSWLNSPAVMRPPCHSLGVEALCATPTFSEIGDSERKFLSEARRATQRKVKQREKSAERREADTCAIEAIANTMVAMTEGPFVSLVECNRAEVAAGSGESAATVDRLWYDALWFAVIAGGGSLTPQLELKIATDALTSVEVVQARNEGRKPPYSNRQQNMVRLDNVRCEYLQKIENLPSPARLVQSGWDRVNIGYQWETAGRVGGATQADGQGKYLNQPFVEKGFRSNTVKGAILKRLVAATAKVGARRRGINDPKKIEKILCLHNVGKSYKEIATEVDESDSRVRAVVWNRDNGSVLRTGLTNDNRILHRYKRVALDQIHGNLRIDCKDVFRIDYDGDFEDVQALIDFISRRKVVPQVVVWVRDDARPGVVSHPHFIFMLPEGFGVWYGERIGSAMLEAVASAINADYGGDPGGLANIFDSKLPTSPHTDYICPETEHLLTLSELCKIYDVDLRNNLTRAARQQTVKKLVDAGVARPASMALYTLFCKRGWEIAQVWESTGVLLIDDGLDRAVFHEELVEALLEDAWIVAEMDKLDFRQRAGAEKALRSAARGVSEKYGRHRRCVNSRGFDVGAAEAETERAVAKVSQELTEACVDAVQIKTLTIRAARQAGQTYASKQRVLRTIRKICDHIGIVCDAGRDPTADEIAKSTGFGKRTVEKHWDAAVAQLAANRIVATAIRPVATPTKVTVETISRASANSPDADRPDANSSRVWGEPSIDNLKEIVASTPPPQMPPAASPVKLENLLPAPLMRLIDRLGPWNSTSSRRPPLGRNLLEFAKAGFTVYRPMAARQGRSPRARIGRGGKARKPADAMRFP
jgi:hypothetical protein